MTFTKHIPNVITLCNLACGLVAMIWAFNMEFEYAFLWICLGIFFDFWDGFIARVLKAQSPLGLQLDSLADMVTSGVVPGLIIFQMLIGITEYQEEYNLSYENYYFGLLPYFGFIITLASCYRLAKFNIDTRQTDSFIGLPTPANALLIASLAAMTTKESTPLFVIDLLSNPYVLVGISLVSAFMLNAEIPLFSLKVKYFNWETNKVQIIFLIVSVLMLFFFQYLAIPLIILFYVLLSAITNKLSVKTIA